MWRRVSVWPGSPFLSADPAVTSSACRGLRQLPRGARCLLFLSGDLRASHQGALKAAVGGSRLADPWVIRAAAFSADGAPGPELLQGDTPGDRTVAPGFCPPRSSTTTVVVTGSQGF